VTQPYRENVPAGDLVEVPNPRHPFSARGVGEVPIVPPMAAVANAIADATKPERPSGPRRRDQRLAANRGGRDLI
jgi:CO/xanthine dehydrogenase Mo-binding subunit